MFHIPAALAEFRRQTDPIRCFGVDSATETIDAGLAAYVRALAPQALYLAKLGRIGEAWVNGRLVGSTGAMMKYVKTSNAPYYLMLTECGLVGRLEVEAPEKNFIGGCRLCPYMKLNSLEKILQVLKAPRADQIVTLDEGLRQRAQHCIDRMFELAPRD